MFAASMTETEVKTQEFIEDNSQTSQHPNIERRRGERERKEIGKLRTKTFHMKQNVFNYLQQPSF